MAGRTAKWLEGSRVLLDTKEVRVAISCLLIYPLFQGSQLTSRNLAGFVACLFGSSLCNYSFWAFAKFFYLSDAR